MRETAHCPTFAPVALNGREPWRPRPAEWIHTVFHPRLSLGLGSAHNPRALKADDQATEAAAAPTPTIALSPAKQSGEVKPRKETVLCAACLGLMEKGSWWARIEHNRQFLAFCRPGCAEAFHAEPAACIRRIETMDWMESHPPSLPEYSPLND